MCCIFCMYIWRVVTSSQRALPSPFLRLKDLMLLPACGGDRGSCARVCTVYIHVFMCIDACACVCSV